MSEAKFIKTNASSNSYQLYNSDTNPSTTPEVGTKAITGGTLYQASVTTTKSWENTSEPASLDGVIDYQSNDDWSPAGTIAREPATYHYYMMNVTTSWCNVTTDPGNVNFCYYDPATYSTTNLPDVAGIPVNTYIRFASNGATYKYYQNTRTWTSVNATDLPENVQFEGVSFSESDITNVNNTNYEDGKYIRFPHSTYTYYLVENDGGNGKKLTLQDSEPGSGSTIVDTSYSSDEVEIHASEFTVGNYVRVTTTTYTYYKMVRSWTDVTNNDGVDKTSANEPLYAESDRDNHKNENGIIKFASNYDYYQVVETRSWSGPTDTQNSSSTWTKTDPNFAEGELNDNKNAVDNNQSVCFPYTYTYYIMTETTNRNWGSSITYSDGETKDISFHFATDTEKNNNTTATKGQYAVVGGTERVYTNSGWQTASTAEEYDYSQMKFSYWSSTLKNAVTSKYADSNISGEIFSNCSAIETVDFKAGVVKGLTGKTTLQSLNVGKDVTEIASDALKESGVQTVTFDKDYTAVQQSAATGYYNCVKTGAGTCTRPDYPKDLTIGMYAFQDCHNLESIEFPNRVISIGSNAFKQAGTNVTGENGMQVSFERRLTSGTTSTSSIDYDHDLTIGDAAFYGCTTLKSIELPIRLSSLGDDAFKLTSHLESVTIREDLEDARLTTLPTGVFQESGLTSIKIPKSVTLIETNAFGSCYYLTEIEFQESNQNPQPPLTIKSCAFAGGDEAKYKLRTVKVDYLHTTRLTVCEYNAFNFTSLVGQTSVDSKQMATLVFPEEDWDFYQGDWKKGLGFDQSRLNAFKDGYSGERGTSQPTVDSSGKVAGVQPANGWQQFAMSNSAIELVVPLGSYIRSYSTPTNFYIPKLASNTSQDMMELYRVTSFSDGWESGMDVHSREEANKHARIATATRVEKYIPANTGLIMVGKGEATSYLIYQREVTNTDDITELEASYYFPYQQSGEKINLLYPSCKDDGNLTTTVTNGDESVSKVILNPTLPYPIGDLSDEYKDSKYRIFGFKGAERKFYRSQPGVLIDRDMAYLKLPISMFHWADETGGTGSSGTGQDTTNPTSNSSRVFLEFAGEDNSEITIVNDIVVTHNSDNCYYTVQGQKISRPQHKGLYIHNGKKIFVK